MKKIILIVFIVSGYSGAAFSKVIEQTINLDYDESSISSWGTGESAFEMISTHSAIDPFTVEAGDRILTHIIFGSPLKIIHRPDNTFNDYVHFNYYYDTPPANLLDVRSHSTINVTDGQARFTEIYNENTYSGSGFPLYRIEEDVPPYDYLTDSYVVFDRIDIETEIDYVQSPPVNISTFQIGFMVADIEVIPEPASAILLIVGVGLFRFGRRKR